MKSNRMLRHAVRALFILCLTRAIGAGAPQASSQKPDAVREARTAKNGFRAGRGPSLPNLKAALWAPPDIDASVPPVSAGIPCALEDVVQGAGRRAKEWVGSLER